MIKVGKKNVVRCLRNLASYDFQKQAWLASSGPIVSSFAEDVCQLFNDTGLDLAMEAGETVFGKDADQALLELRKATSSIINQKLPPKALLDHPIVQAIRKKAGEALQLITGKAV